MDSLYPIIINLFWNQFLLLFYIDFVGGNHWFFTGFGAKTEKTFMSSIWAICMETLHTKMVY